jgi:AcrR family transcriptional regulator
LVVDIRTISHINNAVNDYLRKGTIMTSRPRGRPRSFDPDIALGAATERFRAGGYAGTSLDDLADATGLNRPSLYAAFGDKRALYLAALDRTTARLGLAFDALAQADLPPRKMLKALFHFAIDGFLTGDAGPAGCIAISTASTAAVDDPAIRERLATFVALEDDRVEALLTAGGDTNAAMHARLVAAVIHSLSVRARAGVSRAALDRLAADCVDMVAPPLPLPPSS